MHGREPTKTRWLYAPWTALVDTLQPVDRIVNCAATENSHPAMCTRMCTACSKHQAGPFCRRTAAGTASSESIL